MRQGTRILAYASPRLLFRSPPPGRDQFLDIAKGWAILLVVLGHTFQGQATDFDHLFRFRLVYSFHMPLFMFLSGAAAEHWLRRLNLLDGTAEILRGSIKRLFKSVLTLLVPFLAWTIIGFYYWKRPGPLSSYLWLVFKQPDYSLWYLPCLFWCTCFMLVSVMVTTIGLHAFRLGGGRVSRDLVRSVPLQALVAFVGWCWLSPHMPTQGGLVFANLFDSGLFAFFVLGVVSFRHLPNLKSIGARLVPYVIFALLVPYWYRTTPYSLAVGAPSILREGQIAQGFAFVVAAAGSLAFLDLIRMVHKLRIPLCDSTFRILGTASLAIYALEFYFLGYRPAVIAPIILSLVTYQLLVLLPLVDTLLFGGR